MQNQTSCTFSSFLFLWMLLEYNMNKINAKLWYALLLIWDLPKNHPYPLSVSWPRRRTRCTSLWSTVPVNRLAWYGPSPVWPQTTWTAERHTAAHPSSTWASFPDPIGRSGYPSNCSTSVLPLTLWLSGHRMDPGWAEGSRPGSRPSSGAHSRVGARQRKKEDES